MLILSRGNLLAVLALAAACDGPAPEPAIDAVTPSAAYSDRDQRIIISGKNFLPSYTVNATSLEKTASVLGFSGTVGPPGQQSSVKLRDFVWRGVGEMSATLERGLPQGTYSIAIEDPRGRRAVRDAAFRALGSDHESPEVRFESPQPASIFAPGMSMPVRISASDPAPGRLVQLFWQARGPDGNIFAQGDCPVDLDDGSASCAQDVVIPAGLRPGDAVQITATAIDNVQTRKPNQTSASLSFSLRAPPRVAGASPAYGGVAGDTDVVIKGSGFLPGSRAFIGDLPLVPNGGILLDEETITGRTPGQTKGGALAVMVRTPIGEAVLPEGFDYRYPPQIQGIEPASGPAGGGTVVRVSGQGFTSGTRVYLGNSLASSSALRDLTRTGPGEFYGSVPAGAGRTSVWVFDPPLGWTRLAGGFTWTAAAP